MRRGLLLVLLSTACLPPWHDLRGRSCAVDADCEALRCLAGICGGPERPDGVEPNSWVVSVNSMASPREYPSAAKLLDGRVLVTGGRSAPGVFVATASLFDPVTNRFSETGALSVARFLHASVALGDGDVLVAGGIAGAGELRSAEVYRDASRTFEPADDLPFDFGDPLPSATPWGAVLVASSADRRALRFDSGNRSWTALGASTAYHSASAAVTLADRKVLVLDSNDCELLDPQTGAWTPSGKRTRAQYNHAAALVSGNRVLVVGGTVGSGQDSLKTAQLFDVANKTLEDVPAMQDGREDFSATLLPDGRVLVAGGFEHLGGTSTPLASAELFDPERRSWLAAAPLASARFGHSAVALPDGSVLLVGGSGVGGALADAERYYP